MDASTETAALTWFEEGLRFKCTGCGQCCTGTAGSVSLSTPDLERLAAFFRLPVGGFVRKYTRLLNGRRSLNEAPGSHDCVFLRDGACSVYEARPTQCRTYPWWLSNIRDRESWQEASRLCEGIDHPGASLVPASEIIAAYRQDLDNDAALQQRQPRRRR